MSRGTASPSHFTAIEYRKPSDLIIRQIRDLISDGVLEPGDRLPPERELASRFDVGRGYVREAIKKLEFYGILKTWPQSGTVVAGLGVETLEGLISNVLSLEDDQKESLIEVRGMLEEHSTRLAGERMTQQEIAELEEIHEKYQRLAPDGFCEKLLELDMLFHLKLAEGAHNGLLRSLIGLIVPDIIQMGRDTLGSPIRPLEAIVREHREIIDGIKRRNPGAGAEAMATHMAEYERARKSTLALREEDIEDEETQSDPEHDDR